MTRKFLHKQLIPAVMLTTLGMNVFSAETTIKGFASIVGGTVLNGVELPSGKDSTYLADAGNAVTDDGLENVDASYTDSMSYRPDSNYGLQVKSDLSRGLSVTAQITGRGSEAFKSELEWAYISYDLTSNTMLQAGRQRMPLYYYSDFIDVGYAYHWIRPPADVYSNSLPTYEGVSLTFNSGFGDWTTQTRLYTGMTSNKNSRFGAFGSDGLYGFVFNISNDWLQFRASYLGGEYYTSGITDRENVMDANFGSIALNMEFGHAFFVTEVTSGWQDEGSYLSTGTFQLDALDSSMASVGYQFDNLTPHFTYSNSGLDFFGGLNPMFEGVYTKRESLTLGLRWDFHPAAAFKVEYTSAKDKAHDLLIAIRGKADEVDVLTFGFDVVF